MWKSEQAQDRLTSEEARDPTRAAGRGGSGTTTFYSHACRGNICDPRQRRRIRWPVVLRSMMQIVLNRIHAVYTALKRGKMIEPVHGFLPLVVDGHEVCASYKRCCPACLKRTVNGKTH